MLDKKYQVLNIGYTKEVGRDKWVFYADEKSNLITKMEYHHQTDAGNVLPEEFFWSDYKEIGGLMISQKCTGTTEKCWKNISSQTLILILNYLEVFTSDQKIYFQQSSKNLVKLSRKKKV